MASMRTRLLTQVAVTGLLSGLTVATFAAMFHDAAAAPKKNPPAAALDSTPPAPTTTTAVSTTTTSKGPPTTKPAPLTRRLPRPTTTTRPAPPTTTPTRPNYRTSLEHPCIAGWPIDWAPDCPPS